MPLPKNIRNYKAYLEKKKRGPVKTFFHITKNENVPAPNEANRYSVDFVPAFNWTNEYRDYVKPGESIRDRRRYEFTPGAISRGMGGAGLPPIKDRHFDWNTYNKFLDQGASPRSAASMAQPRARLDWDNIVLHNVRGYGPRIVSGPGFRTLSEGAISRGLYPNENSARLERQARQEAAEIIRRKRDESRKYLTRGLGRRPTAEEIDAWTRAGIFNNIEAGDIPDAPRF